MFNSFGIFFFKSGKRKKLPRFFYHLVINYFILHVNEVLYNTELYASLFYEENLFPVRFIYHRKIIK